MNNKHCKILIAAMALSVFMPTAGYAADRPAAMEVAGRTSQPIGHHVYCKSYSSDCRIISRNTSAPELTRQKWEELVEVNTYSNSTVKPVTDLEAYNQEEFWTYPRSYGDCEDFVLMKRHMLMQRGWPASSLLITVVRQPNGEGHAVLTVRTSKGDFILDNLENKIKRWDKTPYTYLKRQAVNHSGHWSTILDRRS